MKTSAPVHVDRLAKALKAQGINIKRSKIIELAAAAFGYHNSNEFQAAAKSGDLSPPAASTIGSVSLPDGTRLMMLRDGNDQPYAISPLHVGSDRTGQFGVTPYGGLVTLPSMQDAPQDLDRIPATASADIAAATTSSIGGVCIDLETLSTLVEAADAHTDRMRDDLEDDEVSSEEADTTQDSLDGVNAAVVRARSLYAGNVDVADNAPPPKYDTSRFVLVSKEALDRVIGAAESHLEDAETGVEDGIYDADENLWTEDLQAAIDAVSIATPLDASDQIEAADGVVHVAIMRAPAHDEVRFSADPVNLDAMIAAHCRTNWGSLKATDAEDIDPSLLPDPQVVEIFYSTHAMNDEPEYSLDRREQETDCATVSQLSLTTMTIDRAEFHPRFDPAAVAERLKNGIEADIWDTDASARHDGSAVTEIADAKSAMAEAAEMLRGMVAGAEPQDERSHVSKASGDEPIWLTDVEGDVSYAVTREELENLRLDYERGDGKNDWLPLTSDEFELLHPGSSIASDGWTGRYVRIPDMEGMEIRLGQSCLWQRRKWLVPAVEFEFSDGEGQKAYDRLETYVRDLVPLLSRIGGTIRVQRDATDYAHGVDVFLPMKLALEFQGSEDLMRALQWLLCPADLRDGMVRVKAGFGTTAELADLHAEWDATFDVLLAGMAWAQAYVQGARDGQSTMRLAESGLAHKDAWNLWNKDWELVVDTDALKRLYCIR